MHARLVNSWSMAAALAIVLSGCGGDDAAGGASGGSGAASGSGGGGTGGTGGSSGSAGTGTGGVAGIDISAIIPDDRLPLPGTWQMAGVEGGIPKRDTVCADVTQAPYNADATGVASAAAAIQAAIDACPDGQVVSVPPGTYLIDDTLLIKSAITLRGAGKQTEFRVPAGSAVRIGALGPWPLESFGP